MLQMKNRFLRLNLLAIGLCSAAIVDLAAAEPSKKTRSVAAAAATETFAKADDGTPLTWKVFAPPTPGKHPAVLLIHGGGFTRSPVSPQAHDAATSIAGAGHWVFEITYRLAPPGQIPGQKSKGQFPDQTNDVHLAVHAARVDPRCNGQVGGIGGSAGGYHVAFAALTGKTGDDRLDVGVCLSGAYDLSDVDSQKLNAQFKAKVINYAGSDHRDKLRAASPVSYVTADAPPLFLIQSTREAMPYQQLPGLVAKMLSIPVKSLQQQLILPGRAHSWANWPKVKDQAIAFLKAGFAQKSKPEAEEGLDAKIDLK